MEEVYQLIFPSKLGRAAKPFRLLYGAQLIKQKYGWSDGCRGAYSANHIFAAFCMHINPKEKYTPVYNSSATPWRLDQKGHEDLFLLVLAKQESRNLHDPLSD